MRQKKLKDRKIKRETIIERWRGREREKERAT